MTVVDSSAWLEHFVDGQNAAHFAKAIEGTESLLVPGISILEALKKVLIERGEDIGPQRGHRSHVSPLIRNHIVHTLRA